MRALYCRLKADGFAPWLDEEELLPGQDWHERITAAVRASQVVIVVLSKKSVNKEGYLQREIREALFAAEEKPEGSIFIIPVRLEEVEVPRRLSQWQWANLFQENGYQRLVRALNVEQERLAALETQRLAAEQLAPVETYQLEQERLTKVVASSVAAYTGNHEPADEDKLHLNLKGHERRRSLNLKRSLATVLLALLLLVVVGGGWTLWNKHKSQQVANVIKNSQDSDTSAPISKASDQLPKDSGTQTNTSDAGPTTSLVAEKKNSTARDQKTASSAPSTSSNDSDIASRPSASNDSAVKQRSSTDSLPSDSTPVSKQLFTVSIKATEDSWISIVADGKQKLEGILNSGKQKSVTAGKELVLLTGNAGGIEVSYNGKPIASLGKKQQKRTVTFTPQGLKE